MAPRRDYMGAGVAATAGKPCGYDITKRDSPADRRSIAPHPCSEGRTEQTAVGEASCVSPGHAAVGCQSPATVPYHNTMMASHLADIWQQYHRNGMLLAHTWYHTATV